MSEFASSSDSSNVISFTGHLIGRPVSLALIADGNLVLPEQLRAQIKRSLELIKAEAHFFAQRSPHCKYRQQEALLHLGSIFAEYPPCLRAGVIFRCVAVACLRLVTAPANVHVMSKTTWRWSWWIMERVTWGRVRRVQVLLQRRACCAVRCTCRANACVLCVFDACCSKRCLIFRCVAAHRSG
jgi:hypothetical protein